jgi:hypothetical protein
VYLDINGQGVGKVTLSNKESNTPDGQKQSRTSKNVFPFRVYLLTVWREADQEVRKWRFRLEDPHTHWRRGFVDAQGLLALLEKGVPEYNANVEEDPETDE